jgi:hypothetical protein
MTYQPTAGVLQLPQLVQRGGQFGQRFSELAEFGAEFTSELVVGGGQFGVGVRVGVGVTGVGEFGFQDPGGASDAAGGLG